MSDKPIIQLNVLNTAAYKKRAKHAAAAAKAHVDFVPFVASSLGALHKDFRDFLQLNDVAILLFTSEFKLHLPGGPYDFPAPGVVAFAAGSAEILLPILLVIGLATRFAAFGLLLTTLVVQLTIPSGWPLHLTWAAMALGIMAWGPGRISLDHWIKRLKG